MPVGWRITEPLVDLRPHTQRARRLRAVAAGARQERRPSATKRRRRRR